MFRKTRNTVLRWFGVLAAGSALAGWSNAGNIVLDPSFESPAVQVYQPGPIGDGWYVSNAGQILIDDVTDGFAPHTGTQAAYMDYSTTNNQLAQDLPTIPGQSYTISFWLADDSPNPFGVEFGSQVLMDALGPANGTTDPSDYVQYTFDAVATDTTTTLLFGAVFNHGSGTFLDDVSVTADAAASTGAPEPSTFVLMTAALAIVPVIAIWRRNRKTRATLRAMERLQ